MFCPNCGKEVGENDRYCGNCSFELIGRNVRHVSPLVAMVLSIFLPGLGITYVSGDPKGVLIFVASVLCVVMMFTPLWLMAFAALFFLWVYGICTTSHELDSYRMKHGRYRWLDFYEGREN